LFTLYFMVFWLSRYDEQLEIASHKYRKEVKDLNYQLQEAESRIGDMQEQVLWVEYYTSQQLSYSNRCHIATYRDRCHICSNICFVLHVAFPCIPKHKVTQFYL